MLVFCPFVALELAQQPLPRVNVDPPWVQNGPFCVLTEKHSSIYLAMTDSEALWWCQKSIWVINRCGWPFFNIPNIINFITTSNVGFNFISTSIYSKSHFHFISYHIGIIYLVRNVSRTIVVCFFLILNLTNVSESHTCLSIIKPSCVKLSASCSLGNMLTFAFGFCSHLLTLEYLNIQIPTLHLRHEQISGAWISHLSPVGKTLWSAFINAAFSAMEIMLSFHNGSFSLLIVFLYETLWLYMALKYGTHAMSTSVWIGVVEEWRVWMCISVIGYNLKVWTGSGTVSATPLIW